jgi:hypothetical protein
MSGKRAAWSLFEQHRSCVTETSDDLMWDLTFLGSDMVEILFGSMLIGRTETRSFPDSAAVSPKCG